MSLEHLGKSRVSTCSGLLCQWSTATSYLTNEKVMLKNEMAYFADVKKVMNVENLLEGK